MPKQPNSELDDLLYPERRGLLELAQAYRDAFSSDAGRAVLRDLIETHGVLQSVRFAGGTADDFYARDGERTVVLRILEMTNLRWDDIERLLAEGAEPFKDV